MIVNDEAKEIEVKIKEEGNKGRKCFFYASIPKGGQKKKNGVNVVEIKINTNQIQPIDAR